MVRLSPPDSCGCSPQKILLKAASLLQTYGGCSPQKNPPQGCISHFQIHAAVLLKKSSLRLRLPPPDSCNCYPQMVRLSPDLWRLFSSKNPPQGCISHFQIYAAVLLKKSSSRLRLPPPDSCNCYPQMVRLALDLWRLFSSKNPPQGCVSHLQIHEAVLLKWCASHLCTFSIVG